MSSLFGNTDSSTSSSSNAYSSSSGSSSNDNTLSPVMASYNAQLEDPNVGPTLALFGILSSTPSPKSPNLRSSTEFSSSSGHGGSGTAAAAAASVSSLPSSALKLTRRPLCVINQVWSAYAVWPENEALIPHARTFKLHGRMTWLEQEVLSYSQAASSTSSNNASNSNNAPGGNSQHSRTVSGSLNKDPMIGFEEAMRRDNKDLGKADNQVQLLCMLVGNESDANLPGPSHAVAASYKGDTASELLSWILGFYDAFRLHGRPERMIYDPRNPLSPYFAQPAGPARGGLYFDPPLIEDLPQFQDNHPRIINDGFMRILVDRMMKALGGSPMVGNGGFQPQQPITARDVEAYRRGELKTSQKGSAGSTPPVLSPIGESRNNFMGGMGSSSGRSTPTNVNRQMDKPVPQPPTSMVQDPSMHPARPPQPYASEGRSSPGLGRSTTPTATPPINQSATGMFEARPDSQNRSPYDAQKPFAHGGQVVQGRGSPHSQSNYGTPSPPKQGGQSSLHSSPMLQAGMFRPTSANSRTSDVTSQRYSQSGQHSPYLSDREGIRGANDNRSGAVSRGSHTDLDDQEESLRGEEGGSTDLSYYNSRKVRSSSGGALGPREVTPAPSERAPSALSSVGGAALPMPGQYIPTPDLTSNRQLHQQQHQQEEQLRPTNASMSSSTSPPPPNSRALSALEASGHHQGVSEQTLRRLNDTNSSVEDNNSSNSQGLEDTSTMAAVGSAESSALSDRAERAADGGRKNGGGDRNLHGQDVHQHDTAAALYDEPGALYAMSLADDTSHDMSRDPSSTASGHAGNQNPSLSKLIMHRASVANGGIPPQYSASDRSDSLALSDGRTATRQNTYASSESFAARSGAPSRSASQHLQQQQPQPSNLSKQISNTSSSNSSTSNTGLPSQSSGQSQDMRESKASTTSNVPSEGQDDYLAALSYVALAEHQEEPPTPSVTSNGKPIISIQTSPQSRSNGNTAATRQPYSSTDTEASSAVSPTYDEPLSPDPYGTYAENAAANAAKPKMRVTNASVSPRPGSASRKPGRGVPRAQKSAKRLGTWSSDEDEDDDDDDNDKDSVDLLLRLRGTRTKNSANRDRITSESPLHRQAEAVSGDPCLAYLDLPPIRTSTALPHLLKACTPRKGIDTPTLKTCSTSNMHNTI
ncbi:hypothetical protein P389DRAFT_20982 [Cystobasidium minutum MCA 4210]|uniref:uncharacterized protein n=1 Tax=Cystobasidium minutum MCA 4210 TaxID=1397322 RepID=UPI0034CED2C8|eukprot:jgi/Rhomi1/20982/CE20981_6804